MQAFLDVMLLFKRSTPVGEILDFVGSVRIYFKIWGITVVGGRERERERCGLWSYLLASLNPNSWQTAAPFICKAWVRLTEVRMFGQILLSGKN